MHRHPGSSTSRRLRRRVAPLLAGALAVTAFGIAPAASNAATPAAVIDDFDDGDASDWIFFGGNAAGGGGGALDDRPQQGSHYLSTGWGGNGSDSGFYGGFFRNFDDAAQVTPPADPWFNVWVLNQSNATVDQYDLELTLREDTDGNGWTDGTDDSIGFNTTISSSQFDDQWTLVSAPLSDFFDRGTGGNGVFDGNLDEVVIVFGGVQGAVGSVIEVDFDQLSFSSGGPLVGEVLVFDDMEHGDPFANGWFAFGGGGIGPSPDVPPTDGGAFSLGTGWGGAPGFYGGFGRGAATDLTGQNYFNFWINPNAGQEYLIEINLQDDDNGDGAINPPDDDEFQFNCIVGPSGPCATAGGGWQLVSIPLSDFFDDGSFLFGGDGVLNAVPVADGGNGELLNVVFAVIGNGDPAEFGTDHWTFSADSLLGASPTVVDDFENGIPLTTSGNGELLGFFTFQGDGSVSIADEATPPSPALPELGAPNTTLAMTVDVGSFAGFIHAFENAAGDTWVTQDWSTREGIRFWMHGAGSGTQMFIDILDNRSPESTGDDSERWTVPFVDDVAGWRLLEFPFNSFVRKEIGNGAPNDGLGLFEMHGYAIGTLGTPGEVTFYFDEVAVYGVAEPPELAVNFAQQNTFIEEGTTGDVVVKLNRAMGPDDPAQVSIDYATERSLATPGEDFTPTSGTLTFVNGGPSELSFSVETFEDTKFEGDEQVVIRLTNPIDVERGALFQGSVLIDDDDPFDPDTLDDFEQGAYLWETAGPASLDAARSEASSADARPGQDAVEQIGAAIVPLSVDVDIQGNTCKRGNAVIPVFLLSTATFDATSVDHTTVDFGGASEAITDGRGDPVRRVEDVNGDGLDDLVFQFRASDLTVPCDSDVIPFNGATFDGQAITAGGSDAALLRDFPIGQDWTDTESLTFWYQGAGGGDEVTVTLKDNRAPDPGPSGWELAWADEFNEPAGTPPDPANWAYEIGDTTPDGKNGWGNEELQYYTDDPANSATDGDGNLVITLSEADGSQECYYGPCEFESARLITQNRAEFAYGRIESRLKVPDGGDGLWPAFWSLGTDITYNPWPGAGEIDIMEYVSRLPNEIFGTIHGPGYSGGGSFGDIYDFGTRVDAEYHTYTVEWEPNLITWYVDGIKYHEAVPADVPGPWVFEKPFFLLLNFAIGGNFGGAIDPDNTYPQEYLVDYVRVYQGPDTSERFEATFTDDVAGWTEVTIPIGDFVRSAEQPAGAPNDGLTLSDVWGYGFEFPNGTATGEAGFDLVRRVPVPPPTDVVVTSLADSGEGSLRQAIATVADGGTITFDPALAGGTITLSSDQLTIGKSLTIDGPSTPVTVSGGNTFRVFQVAAGATVAIDDLEIRDGAGAPQGGGILNFGTLSLDRVVVADNVQTAAGPADFQLGGGGIYTGEGATLNLTDSTVADNQSPNQPGGGIYGFFGSTINVVRSTISGNVSGDVAGGLRTLGDATMVNSTISGNTSSAWHGGAWFATDGTVSISNSTIVGNNAPGGTAGGLMVATFGAPVSVTIADNVIADNGTYNCQIEGDPSAAVLTSAGGNVMTDASCAATASDVVVAPGGAGVAALADNGGPTATHALLAGSPAIGAAVGTCPATDQRGAARDAACDSGAFELSGS